MTRLLRPAELRDLSALARLHAQCFPDDRWDAKALAELMAMPGASAHLIEHSEERRPLGLILDIITAGGEAEILTLGVAPAVRQQGVAQALLADLIGRAQKAAAKTISLEVAADNIAGQRLYMRCGFVRSGKRPGYYQRGDTTIDALLFHRTLIG